MYKKQQNFAERSILILNFSLCKLEEIPQEAYAVTFFEMNELRKKKVERYMREQDKQRTILGEYLAKRLLAERFKKQPSDFIIQSDENGKPYVQNVSCHISISHSENMVAAVVSDRPVGIDIEKIRPISFSLIQRVCTAKELAYVLKKELNAPRGQIENPDVLKRFFEVWTTKEACFKCNGGNGKPITEIETMTSEIEKITLELPGYSISVVQIKES